MQINPKTAAKKILLAADVSIASVGSGAERVLLEQALQLKRSGHQVEILTRKAIGHDSESENVNSIQEWRYTVNDTNAVFYLSSTIRNGRKLFERLAARTPYDVIIFHQPFSALAVMNSALGRQARKIYVCHSLSFEEYASRNQQPGCFTARMFYYLNRSARKWIEKKAMKRSDAVIVLSKYTRDKLIRVHHIASGKVSIVPGGVDLDRFRVSSDKRALRRKLGLPEDKIILLTVRNIEPRMGLENLLQAVADVGNRVPDVLLVIGGAGELKEQLELKAKQSGIADKVVFTGFISESKLADYYQMADLFILPTIDMEGFGLVTLEALASGLPVLGTPIGGTREILGRLDSAYLFQDASVKSMADLIAQQCRIIHQRPDVWQEISADCRRFVEDNYSWKRHVESIERLCNSL